MRAKEKELPIAKAKKKTEQQNNNIILDYNSKYKINVSISI